MYGVYTVFFAGKYQIYGHIWCKYTVLADPKYRSEGSVMGLVRIA